MSFVCYNSTGFDLKFAFEPEKSPRLSKNKPPIRKTKILGILHAGNRYTGRVVNTLRIYWKASSFNFAIFLAVGLLAAFKVINGGLHQTPKQVRV